MNKKNKVLLSTVGLLLLSGIAATSSTFAWFTTVRQASIAYGKATVVDKEGNLEIAYKSSLNTLTPDTAVGVKTNDLTLEGVNSVTDISGDGLAFFKPVWADQTVGAEKASVINAVAMAAAGDADGYFVDFTITVSRSNYSATPADDGPGLDVYLGEDTEIVSSDANLIAATRLAVINNGAVMVRWAPTAETTAKYISGTAGTIYGLTTHSLVTESAAPFKNGTAFVTSNVSSTAGLVKVATLGAGVESADLTFRAWIEGEDAQTTNQGANSIVGKTFDVKIDLFALQII